MYLRGRVLQAGAAARRAREEVEGIVWDRKLLKLKGKCWETSVVSACVCGLGTLARTEKQEEKLLVTQHVRAFMHACVRA